MPVNRSASVRYRFERGARNSESALTRFAYAAAQVVRSNPLAVPDSAFGTSSRVPSALLTMAAQESSQDIRLRAIEAGQDTLLECRYDLKGRLAEVVYSDGIRARHTWNDLDALTKVEFSNRRSIVYQYDEDGWLTSSSYTGEQRFSYDYSPQHQLLECLYPDGKRVIYTYDSEGRLERASFLDWSFCYEWTDDFQPSRVVFRSPNSSQELQTGNCRVGFQQLSNGSNQTAMISPLGLWQFSSEGNLNEMLTPDGQRLRTTSQKNGEVLVSWGLQGQTVYVLAKDRRLSSVLWPNGLRTVFHKIPGSVNYFAVGLNGVELYQYNDHGKLVRIQSDAGQYQMFDYGQNGKTTHAKLESGQAELWLENRRITQIKTGAGTGARLHYGSDRLPKDVSIRASKKDGVQPIIDLASLVWRCHVMNSLSDPSGTSRGASE